MANIGVAAATGTIASAAIMTLVVNPFLNKAGGIVEIARATSADLQQAMAAWNKLDVPAQNAIKMQLQGRLAALEKRVEEQAARLAALAEDKAQRDKLAAAVGATAEEVKQAAQKAAGK